MSQYTYCIVTEEAWLLGNCVTIHCSVLRLGEQEAGKLYREAGHDTAVPGRGTRP